VLAPGLRRAQIIVLDNPGAHNSERAKVLTKERNKVAGYSVPAAVLARLRLLP
jgi:hypothetical protein